MEVLWSAACRDPLVTNATGDFMGCLDYIFLSGPFNVLEIMGMPYEEEKGTEDSCTDIRKDVQFGPIPNAAFPSDHLSIRCAVELQ